MKRAELGLLEVLGLLVECRGKVMSRLSPCFARELGILLCYLILRPFLSFFTTKYAYEVQLIGIIPYATSSATYVYPHPNIIIFKLIIVCNAYEVQSIGIPYATLVLLLYHRIIYIVIVFIGIHQLSYFSSPGAASSIF